MYLTNISKYVATGSAWDPNKYVYREQIVVPAVFTIWTMYPGSVLKGYWLLISAILTTIVTICGISIYVVSSKKLTLKKCLFMDVMVGIAWLSAFTTVETICFIMYYGFHIAIIWIYVPIILIPLLIGIKIDKSLKTSEFDLKKPSKGSGKIIVVGSGMSGFFLRLSLKDIDIDQGIATIVIVICCTIVNCIFSLWLLSIQKLYYMIKYDIPEPTK